MLCAVIFSYFTRRGFPLAGLAINLLPSGVIPNFSWPVFTLLGFIEEVYSVVAYFESLTVVA